MQTVPQDSVPSLWQHLPYQSNTVREHVPMQGVISTVVHALELWQFHVDENGSD